MTERLPPDEQLFFEQIRQARDEYVVKYSPPSPNAPFSILTLTYTGEIVVPNVVDSMEQEVRHWLERFPVPLMASAVNGDGVLIDLREARPESHLIAFFGDDGDVQIHWRLLKDPEIPDVALKREYLLKVFSEVPYKTSAELKKEAVQRAKQFRIGLYVVFVWAAILPAVVAILSFFSPLWLSVLALFYGLWKAYVKAMRLLGRWEKSPNEIRDEEEKRRKMHHHYHCERNPEGFRRLRAENFKRWSRERIQTEVAEIRAGGTKNAG